MITFNDDLITVKDSDLITANGYAKCNVLGVWGLPQPQFLNGYVIVECSILFSRKLFTQLHFVSFRCKQNLRNKKIIYIFYYHT